MTSVALEKTQVAALAERMDELLDEVVRRSGGSAAVPAMAPAEITDTAPLDTPVEEEFRVGTMALAWDGEEQRMVVEAQALVELDADSDEDLAEAEERLLQDEENGPRCCASGSPGRRRGPSPSAPWTSSTRDGRRARCAASRSTRKDTYVRARTDTAAERDRHRPGRGRTARPRRADRARTHP